MGAFVGERYSGLVYQVDMAGGRVLSASSAAPKQLYAVLARGLSEQRAYAHLPKSANQKKDAQVFRSWRTYAQSTLRRIVRPLQSSHQKAPRSVCLLK